MMKVELVSVEPEHGSIVLSDLPAMIGRNRTAEIMLTDPDIAQFQAIVGLDNGTLTITDIAGRGILVNGKPVKTADLRPGDHFKVGKSEFLVRYQESSTTNDVRKSAVPRKRLRSAVIA